MDDVLNTIQEMLEEGFPKRKPSSLLLTDASAALPTMKTKFRRKNNHD